MKKILVLYAGMVAGITLHAMKEEMHRLETTMVARMAEEAIKSGSPDRMNACLPIVVGFDDRHHLLQSLIQAGASADANSKLPMGSPLHVAIKRGAFINAEYLLKNGAKYRPYSLNDTLKTALTMQQQNRLSGDQSFALEAIIQKLRLQKQTLVQDILKSADDQAMRALWGEIVLDDIHNDAVRAFIAADIDCERPLSYHDGSNAGSPFVCAVANGALYNALMLWNAVELTHDERKAALQHAHSRKKFDVERGRGEQIAEIIRRLETM